ncbi:salicylate hydroxylase [Amylostereum chailletii]|nr:salicylate hydroxylase [Amylostereum chailletii]
MSAQTKLRVAICGGGVGGLTLAYALSTCPDIDVTVYEAAAQFAEVGAGIGIWWRTRRILQALGLEADVTAIGGRFTDGKVPTLHYRKADQPVGQGISTMLSRGGLTTLHRADFHAILLRRAQASPRCHTYTAKRLLSYTQSASSRDPVRLRFQDGSTATCDVLLGADGIKSAARASMMQEKAAVAEQRHQFAEAAELRDCIRPRYSGVQAYRTVIPGDKLARIAPQHRVLTSPYQYLGRNRHVMAYPISRGRLVNLVVFDVKYNEEGSSLPEPWVSEADPRHVQRLFATWEPEVRQLLSCVDGLQMNRWAVNVVKPLPSYASGRVALLGDAAHAMTPFQGAGAGQAIEDAYMLYTLLSHRLTTRSNVVRVLQVYSQIRLPMASRVADLSRRNGMYFALQGGGDVAARLPELGQRIQQSFDWCSEMDPFVDVRRAVELLETSVGA